MKFAFLNTVTANQSGGSTASRWLFILVLAAAGLALAWVAIQTSVASAFRDSAFPAAARVSGHVPEVALRQAMNEFEAGQGRVSPDTYQRVAEAAGKAPLAEEPFLLYGLQALEAGQDRQALRLLERARELNPRSRWARLFLLDRYLSADRIADAASEITVLSRLVPQEAQEVLIGELARYAQNPRTRPSLQVALRGKPLLERLLLHMVQRQVDPDLILELAGRRAPLPAGAEAAPWQPALLNQLVRKGQVERAHRLWTQFYATAGVEEPGIYDAGFRGLAGSPPFNWDLVQGAAGVAESQRPGFLEVEFFGRRGGNLASQLMVLPPGRYRLGFTAEGSADGEGAKLSWQVVCHGSDRSLLSLPLAGVTYSPKEFQGEFVVPNSGCSAQWLRLAGTAGEFPETQTAAIGNLAVERVGQSQ